MKKILLLVNPVAGKKDGIKSAARISKALHTEYNIESEISKYKGHFIELLAHIELSGYDIIGVVGGDGTMFEVVNGLMKRKTEYQGAIILFPAGSGNSFNYDIGCFTIENAIQNLRNENILKLDILKVSYSNEVFYAFNIVGVGLVADINKTSERYRFLGNARYTLVSLAHILFNPSFHMKIIADEGKQIEMLKSFCLICNTKHTGKGMKMAPEAHFDDGLMDALLVDHTSILTLLKLFPKIFSGTHIGSPIIDYRKLKKIRVDSDVPLLTFIDGEMLGDTPFEIEVLPGKLKVFC